MDYTLCVYSRFLDSQISAQKVPRIRQRLILPLLLVTSTAVGGGVNMREPPVAVDRPILCYEMNDTCQCESRKFVSDSMHSLWTGQCWTWRLYIPASKGKTCETPNEWQQTAHMSHEARLFVPFENIVRHLLLASPLISYTGVLIQIVKSTYRHEALRWSTSWTIGSRYIHEIAQYGICHANKHARANIANH